MNIYDAKPFEHFIAKIEDKFFAGKVENLTSGVNSMTLDLAVTFKKFLKLLCFRVFLDLKQFNRHKLWCSPKCVPLALSYHFSVT